MPMKTSQYTDITLSVSRSSYNEFLPVDRSKFEKSRLVNLITVIIVFSNSVKDESDNLKIPSILDEEKPRSETVKVSEREYVGAIERKTVALDERTNYFKNFFKKEG